MKKVIATMGANPNSTGKKSPKLLTGVGTRITKALAAKTSGATLAPLPRKGHKRASEGTKK